MENNTVHGVTHQEAVELANQSLAERVSSVDPTYRLHYHMMPPFGWMNDPNGLIYFKGQYHLFYQHDPYRTSQGPMHWGHAVSRDLVHWDHLPVALAPSEVFDKGDKDGFGCWSGSAVDKDGELTLIYTGHVDGRTPVEVQALAASADGVHFTKRTEPVIEGPPAAECFGFRDPKVWRHEDNWYMVVGYGKDGLGKALVFTSDDLLEWTYIGPAAESDGTMGDMWECPDLFPLGGGDNHVLLISPMNIGSTKTLYVSGMFDYQSFRLTPRHKEKIDYGFDFYAPQTLEDDKGRRIMITWMSIWGAKLPEQQHGWAGAMTVPRELTLAEDGTLRSNPVAELERLRGRKVEASGVTLAGGRLQEIEGVRGDALELIAIFNVAAMSSEDAEVGLRVRSSADGTEYTEIAYRLADRTLRMDREQSGEGNGGVSEAPLELRSDGSIQLRIYVDRSSVELFANDGRITITNRVYPDPASDRVQFFSRGADAVLTSLEAWELKSIW